MKESLGFRIRQLRIEKGLTQTFVAKQLGYKHSSILSEIESGKKGISAEKLPIVANVLGVDVNSLFFEQNVLDSRTNTHSA
ncbi:transcriptional regulator [Bacillus sp. 7586-K]|nr:transcriptional regulator [Bacillus sp. 7586-K]